MKMTALSYDRGWLDAPAAASLARIDAEIGHPLDINESGRTWAQQNAHYQRYLAYLVGGPWAPIALPPGSSIHEFGRAIDTDEQITAVLNRHGWRHTVYRGGRLVEPWHYEYEQDNDQHRDEGDPEMAGISNEWIGERLGGTNTRGPSITDLLREVDSKLDALALDQTWIKEQLGGSNSRDTSLRQDVDQILREL